MNYLANSVRQRAYSAFTIAGALTSLQRLTIAAHIVLGDDPERSVIVARTDAGMCLYVPAYWPATEHAHRAAVMARELARNGYSVGDRRGIQMSAGAAHLGLRWPWRAPAVATLGLFDVAPATETQPAPAELAAADWIEANPQVYAAFVNRALAARRAGRNHGGAKAIFEALRYDAGLREIAGAWNLNNNYTPHLARRAMRDNAELDGFFELRASKADAEAVR